MPTAMEPSSSDLYIASQYGCCQPRASATSLRKGDELTNVINSCYVHHPGRATSSPMFRNLIQSAVRASTLPRCTFGEFQERQIYFWDYRCIFVPADEQVRVDKVSNGNYTSISAYAIQYMQVTLRSTRLGPSVEIEGRTHKCKLFFFNRTGGASYCDFIKNKKCFMHKENKK
jgi:hypothetical protein